MMPEPALRAPSLPDGYTTQCAGAFHDHGGLVSYEFQRVYGRPEPLAGRPSVTAATLEEDLCYWSSSWAVVDAAGEERPAGRWLSYAQARDARRTHLGFAQFSDELEMREELIARLGAPVGGRDRS